VELFHIGLQLIDEVLLISFRGTDMPVTGQVLGVLSGFVPIALVSVWRYGLHNHLAYLGVLSFLSRHGEQFYPNNSINGPGVSIARTMRI